ncbi:sulfurtransferase [Alkalihalophilus pseudofirmus]|uniref:rhodanese-like domain-containing protein n=1 Tax=Alkalihalophilus pseudofirmus TaxID=79885 RepID=UPI00259BC576|nr:rhodanese-like domain-containing protein [Alkalihalophilus pseudofirmus]WEG17535.1 sulfurtransferase [Alkalihalophilus pseudofirmus]
MTSVVVIMAMGIAYFLYKRYIPVIGLKCTDIQNIKDKNEVVILDVRDFPVANKTSIDGTMNIPLAYLKRYYHDLDKKMIYLVCAERQEVNLSARFLKSKGYRVGGFMIKNEATPHPCRGKEAYGL